MLKRIHLLLMFHFQAATQSLNSLCRKPFATMMTLIVLAITLSLPALFWVLTDNLGKLSIGWQRNGHISVYLKPALPKVEQEQILATIENMQGVGQATLKSSEEGLAELTQQEGMHDIMHYLPDNPLPSVIDVVPALVIDSPAKIDLLSRELQTLQQVEQVKVDMDWINRLHVILGFAANVAKALMVLLALAVVLIIGNTLRLAIQNRHEEIQILKLVGASDSFIMRPFLYSGIWYGLAAAVLAVFLVNIFILSMGGAVNRLAVAYEMHYPLSGLSIRQILLLVLFAIILGWVGARFSVKRQLTSIEPYSRV